MGIENFTEIGFAGLAAGILWMTFRWMTMELNKKIDDLQNIIIKLKVSGRGTHVCKKCQNIYRS